MPLAPRSREQGGAVVVLQEVTPTPLHVSCSMQPVSLLMGAAHSSEACVHTAVSGPSAG